MNRRMLQWRVFFSMATSFLNACNWAGLGVLTFKVLTATGPCQCALYTVPKEPEPIRGPIKISSAWMFYKESKNDWLSLCLALNFSHSPNFHHFACYLLAKGGFCYSRLPIWLSDVWHASAYSWARLGLNGSVLDSIESEKKSCELRFWHKSWRKRTWNGLILWRILWSPAVGGRRTLLMHTFGAELDRSCELSVLGCLKLYYWVRVARIL